MLTSIKEKLGVQKNRWISLVLAILALWMMWFSWVTAAGEIKENLIGGFKYADSFTELAEDFANSMEYSGANVSIGQAKKLINAISDGALSPAEGASVLGLFSNAAGQVKKSMLMSFADEKTSNMINLIRVFNFIYQILFYAIILASLWAIIQRIIVRRDFIGTKVFPLLYIVLLVLILCFWIWSSTLGGGILFYPTIWTIVAPICAVVSSMLWKDKDLRLAQEFGSGIIGGNAGSLNESVSLLKEKGSIIIEKGAQAFQATPPKPWICPKCNAEMARDRKFCTNCGNKRPEPLRCAECGVLQEPGIAFCANCGQKFMPQQKCSKCGAVVKNTEKFCPGCGNPQEQEAQQEQTPN